MKVYVKGWDLKPEYLKAHKAGEPYPPYDNYEVAVTVTPEYTWPEMYIAEVNLRELQGMRVRFNGGHYCQFEIEQVGEAFAIICNDHPALSAS